MRMLSINESKAKQEVSAFEGAKKQNTGNSKLPPVAVGGEMHDQIKELEKTIVKLNEKNKLLEAEMISEKKGGSGKADSELMNEIEHLRKENQDLMVDWNLLEWCSRI